MANRFAPSLKGAVPRATALPWPLLVVAFYSFLAYRFCAVYFPLDSTKLGGSGDFQPYATVDWVVARTLLLHGELPLWNPYFHSGLPLIGDAYISFFNPAVVLPLMVFGAVNGAKVAVVVASALSGIGQYWLNRVLGHSRPVALTAGVVGLSAGSLIAHSAGGFSFGHSMQHAWLALTLASFIVALRSKRPGAIVVAAGCYAMLFHAGNLYLWLVMSAVLVVVGAGYALRWAPTGKGLPLRLDRQAAGVAVAVAAVGGLLHAVRAVPIWQLSQQADKPIDVTFSSTQPPLATILSMVIAERQFWERGLFHASDLGWVLYHSYIGAGLFVFLLVLVPAFMRRPGRDLPLLAVACVLTIAWASARHTFVWELWHRWDVLRQLRYWSSATHVTSVLAIPLALSGADYLWRTVGEHRAPLERWGPALLWRARGPGARWWRLGLAPVALWLALLYTLWAVAADPWRVNQRLLHVIPQDTHVEETYAWLRAYDSGAYAISNHANLLPGFGNVSQVVHGIPTLNSVWNFRMRPRPTPGAPDGGVFVPTPKYIVAPPNAAVPLPNGGVLAQLSGSVIYAGPPGLPFAFAAAPQRLPYGAAAAADALAQGRVVEARARFDGPNRIVVVIPPTAPPEFSTLVVLQSWTEGWSARAATGDKRPMTHNGGYLSLPGVRPGETYVLSYFPPSFVVGAALSALGLAAAAGLLLLETTGGWLRLGGLQRALTNPWRGRLHPRGQPQPAAASTSGTSG